ncbi:hypothetical protein ACLOJK_014260 [Asimina triloba]
MTTTTTTTAADRVILANLDHVLKNQTGARLLLLSCRYTSQFDHLLPHEDILGSNAPSPNCHVYHVPDLLKPYPPFSYRESDDATPKHKAA